MNSPTPLQRSLLARAAVLFLIGLFTGIWAGIVLTQGKPLGLQWPKPEHERLALAAHLNCVVGCFWIVCVALTLEWTRLSESGKLWLARGVTLVNYANWSITLLASFLDVRGLAFEGNVKNDTVAALLIAGVVLPALATSGLWAWGLLGPAPSAPAKTSA
jgi:hydroxylaminobenzene mutase